MSGSRRVAHLTTAHGRRELRVHLKECNSLAAAGYEVHLVVADGKGPETDAGVRIHDIGSAGSRFQRMLLRPWMMWLAARRLDARVYHFHDPELLLIAPFLRLGGARVVYDSHEDVPRSLMSREWVPRALRGVLARVFETFEDLVAGGLAAVVGATPHIADRFAKVNPRTLALNNYPLQSEIAEAVEPSGEARQVCYLGGIGRIRGIREMIQALDAADARLVLAGPFESAATEAEARALPGWSRVDYRGIVSRAEVRKILSQSRAGMLFLHPEPNHVDAQPNKLFEYMSAGVPVLASDFPLWRALIEAEGAGLCADPLSPPAIAAVLRRILDDPEEARAMGRRGREAVLARYRWDIEEAKLRALYEELTA